MVLQQKRFFGAVRCVGSHFPVNHPSQDFLPVMKEHSVVEHGGITDAQDVLAESMIGIQLVGFAILARDSTTLSRRNGGRRVNSYQPKKYKNPKPS